MNRCYLYISFHEKTGQSYDEMYMRIWHGRDGRPDHGAGARRVADRKL